MKPERGPKMLLIPDSAFGFVVVGLKFLDERILAGRSVVQNSHFKAHTFGMIPPLRPKEHSNGSNNCFPTCATHNKHPFQTSISI